MLTMNKTNGNIKTNDKIKGEKQKMPRMTKAITIDTVHTHTSNLGKTRNIYNIREKGNIILSSSYYDTG